MYEFLLVPYVIINNNNNDNKYYYALCTMHYALSLDLAFSIAAAGVRVAFTVAFVVAGVAKADSFI